ncbi:MAG TPA: NAD-dependent epimerase/dehydratase family protein, partial [Vicinamibacteria bacterium]|nr:NAD-dependent epimerase/dehydratase family protein [Vicinamibacteria bacterium]
AGGHEVRVLVRDGSNLAGLGDAQTALGDVTDAESLRRAAEGCQGVFHMAALVKMWVPDRSRFDAVNVGGLRNALAAAESAGARLVYTSSFIAVGPTGAAPVDETRVHPGDRYRNDYERTKAVADGLAQQAIDGGQDVVRLYPGVVYGPGELTDGNLVVKTMRDHLRGKLPGLVGPGDRLWSYAFVEDVAEGHVQALAQGRAGERYFLAGDNVTMDGFYGLVAELTGVPAPRRHIPYAAAWALGLGMWAWAELTGHEPQLTHQVVNVFREHWAYSSAKAQAELGYRPRSLREGLQATLDWLKGCGLYPKAV